MDLRARVGQIAREVGGVVPRSVDHLTQAGGWNARSVGGLRQLGEVALDELAVTLMTLGAAPPSIHSAVQDYQGVAAELVELGFPGAYREPNPLQVRQIRRKLAGQFSFEQLTYDHDPQLPDSLRALGGPSRAVCNLVRHPGGRRRPWLVWVHGAGQGGLSDFPVARVGRIHRKLGFNVALPIQPGHGPRRGWWPSYPDTDPLSNVAGMMRTVSEVRAVIRWLEPQATVIALSGLSLGSGVAALVSSMEPAAAAVALYTPIRGLNAMIANHLHRWGGSADEVSVLLSSPAVSELTKVIDPLQTVPMAPPHRRLIVGAWHDQMALRAPALEMHEKWGGQLHWHDGSHVGHLFSRRVQAVTEQFLRVASGD